MFLLFNRHFGRRHLVRAALGCSDGRCPFVSLVALLTWQDLLFRAKDLLIEAIVSRMILADRELCHQ
jgi:hypothetical protein